MQKTLAKSIVALLLVIALCLGMTWALLPTQSNVAQAAVEEWDNPYTGDYYNNLNEDKSGLAFRSDLAKLITDTHKVYTSYSGDSELALNNVWQKTDIDPNTGKMLWFYTGTPQDGFSGSSNREHVWPKDGGAAFPKSTGPGSDAHHLRPTDSTLNSTRGSLSFGEVTGGKEAKEAGKPSGCYYDGSFFYPQAGYRGQTARILMYVQTRWGDAYNLKFVLGKGHSKTIGDIETLFKWHLEEPPTEAEIYRNNAVAAIQGNRNPFIDHPEYAAQIYCYDGESYNANLLNVLATVGDPYDNTNTEPLEGLSFDPTQMTLAAGQQTTLTAIKTPQKAKARLTWTSDNTSVAEVSNGGVVTAKNIGSAIITARDSETGISASVTIKVKGVVSISVSGTPNKLEYTAGERFDPTGLVVTAIFSDNTMDTVPLDSCTWTDGTTGSTDLSEGTTTVKCSLGSLTQTVTGITVVAYEGGGTEVINVGNFDSGGYKVHTWTAGDIGGIAFIYTSGNRMQFNTGKGGCYVASNKPAPGGIKSITVKLHKDTKTDKDWELLTNDTPYEAPESGDYPTTGKSQGVKSVNQDGVTWELDGSAAYFTLNYKSTGACYLESITIEYGAGGGGSTPTPTPTPDSSVSLNITALSLTVGNTRQLTATTAGDGTLAWSSNNTSVATVSANGTITAVSAGTAIITASYGGKTANCTVTVKAGGSTIDPTPNPSVSLDISALSLYVGSTQKIVATTTGTGSLAWTSSNVNVAMVSADGTVTAVSAGTAIITANYGGQTAICTVIVKSNGSANTGYAAFVAAVQQVSDSTTQTDICAAIKLAISEYNKLTATQKQDSTVIAKYAELQQAIEAYNDSIDTQNSEMQLAIKTALSGFYGTTVTLTAAAAALMLIKRRFF